MPISSEGGNNINSSVDIDKLEVKKKGKKGKGKKKGKRKKNKQQEEIDKALIQLEKNNKEKMLVGELADIMEEIEIENKDFKKNVFFSNFHDLNNNLGIFDEAEGNNIPKDNYPGVKDEKISPYGLINKYTEEIYNIISYTYYLLKNTYWTFDEDKEYYIRVVELNHHRINIYSCYEPFIIDVKDHRNFCKTARYGYDTLIKTLIILCGYYNVFNKWWDTDDNSELKERLTDIQEYLKVINFKINFLYDNSQDFGYYESNVEVDHLNRAEFNNSNGMSIYTSIILDKNIH